MAISTCVKCDGHSFQVVEKDLTGAQYKLMFVQCSSCGGVVGVTEYFNTGALLSKLAKKLGVNL